MSNFFDKWNHVDMIDAIESYEFKVVPFKQFFEICPHAVMLVRERFDKNFPDAFPEGWKHADDVVIWDPLDNEDGFFLWAKSEEEIRKCLEEACEYISDSAEEGPLSRVDVKSESKSNRM